MPRILGQIKHIVVVMLENRSLDDMCGWLYNSPASSPSLFLPAGSATQFNGLNSALWNPRNVSYFSGGEPDKLPVMDSATSFTNPGIDPEETFVNVTYQINGPGAYTDPPKYPMQGFVVNYENATAGNPVEIMEPFSPAQVPILSRLAQHYAISDAWFCSVPSQTWPNRSFVHAGTSNGNCDNGDYPNPFDWNVTTIFNVLNDVSIPWAVYSDTVVVPSLTRSMFPKLWDPLLEGHFKGIADFEKSCQAGTLEAYSFVEPSFLTDPNDEHPPHDVRAGEQFLLRIFQAVSQSPKWEDTLLIITYDEHGGTYDHVLPPAGAVPPDQASSPGQYGFGFDRFGVRVPTLLVSPWIEKGTVFRSNTSTPLDHTSILATLRDWLQIEPEKMLPSKRAIEAPTLEYVLTLQTPRTDLPTFPAVGTPEATLTSLPPNDLQRSLISANARRFGLDPHVVLGRVKTRQHAIEFFQDRALQSRSR